MKLSTKLGAMASAAVLAATLAPAAAMATPTTSVNGATVTDVNDTTVTISGLASGDTVTAYLIGDAYIDASNQVQYNLVSGLPTDYDAVDELSAVTSDGYAFTVNSDAQKAATAIAASTAVTGAADTAKTSVTATGTSAQLSLGSGYYLVRVTNATTTNDRVYQNMLVNLEPVQAVNGTYSSATDPKITAKQTPVTIDKKSKQKSETEQKSETDYTETEVNTFNVGDKVPFQITTAIPSYNNNSTYATFSITDDPDTGLKIDSGTVEVTVAGADTVTKDTDYTVTNNGGDGDPLTIAFNQNFVLAHPGAAVTVTYKAELTSNAKVTKSGTVVDYTNNTAKVTYTPDTNHETTTDTEEKHVDVKTYGIYFQKVDKDGNALVGAEFTIYDASGNIVTAAENTSNGVAASDANGYVWFDGLASGTYTLKETKVPAGKQAVANFTVTVGDNATLGDNPATGTTENPIVEANFVAYDGNANDNFANAVVDPDRGILPTTGDAGTVALTVCGVGLLAVGFAVMTRNRKQDEQA